MKNSIIKLIIAGSLGLFTVFSSCTKSVNVSVDPGCYVSKIKNTANSDVLNISYDDQNRVTQVSGNVGLHSEQYLYTYPGSTVSINHIEDNVPIENFVFFMANGRAYKQIHTAGATNDSVFYYYFPNGFLFRAYHYNAAGNWYETYVLTSDQKNILNLTYSQDYPPFTNFIYNYFYTNNYLNRQNMDLLNALHFGLYYDYFSGLTGIQNTNLIEKITFTYLTIEYPFSTISYNYNHYVVSLTDINTASNVTNNLQFTYNCKD